MDKQRDREKIVQEIKTAASLYKKHLVGKRFLYVFEGRYIEVIYKAANFRHLTGVATKTYKFGKTNLNFTLCMNKELDANGLPKGDCFVVESLRDEDCFSKSRTAYAVTHIFSVCIDR